MRCRGRRRGSSATSRTAARAPARADCTWIGAPRPAPRSPAGRRRARPAHGRGWRPCPPQRPHVDRSRYRKSTATVRRTSEPRGGAAIVVMSLETHGLGKGCMRLSPLGSIGQQRGDERERGERPQQRRVADGGGVDGGQERAGGARAGGRRRRRRSRSCRRRRRRRGRRSRSRARAWPCRCPCRAGPARR